eukprot:GHRQ01029920.1.p1 GENE.GHRQ01029920.1~~GHRQ01029920.1.p1  ORF type:complete len:174 (-),score=22.47 GHRQ01029920.1:942-1463(-)
MHRYTACPCAAADCTVIGCLASWLLLQLPLRAVLIPYSHASSSQRLPYAPAHCLCCIHATATQLLPQLCLSCKRAAACAHSDVRWCCLSPVRHASQLVDLPQRCSHAAKPLACHHHHARLAVFYYVFYCVLSQRLVKRHTHVTHAVASLRQVAGQFKAAESARLGSCDMPGQL